MFNQFRSIRLKLFLSYLVFILTALITAVEIFWVNDRLSELIIVENKLNEFHLLNAKLYKSISVYLNKEREILDHYENMQFPALEESKSTLVKINKAIETP
jgi:hypothetical protein